MARARSKLGSRVRRSLSLRVSLLIVLTVTVAFAVMGAYIMGSIRNGLFEARIEDMIGDASYRIEATQTSLDAANVSTAEQVQNAASNAVQSLREPTAGLVGSLLLRLPSQTSTVTIQELTTNTLLPGLVTDEMRNQVANMDQLVWQSTAIPLQDTEVPGVVIGGRVNVPLAGWHELYLFYSLQSEQETLNLMLHTFALGAILLVVILGVSIWAIMWRVLRPVREAALTAERLAAGLLDQRMDVRGTDELATLGRSFNEMAASLQRKIEQLQELSRLQRRFVSDVSHELRTPLTTISMAADVLYNARPGFEPATRRSAELLHNQLERFESMLADLLEISRFDAGAAVLTHEEQDLRPLVRRVVDFAQPLAERRGTTVRLHGFDHTVTAVVDSRRVERIVRNLVVNAIEHCDGTPVDVTLYDNETAVAVRVTDTGVGMSEETAARVFDRFWRADPARARTTGGTGLGLAIALEDARLHGGTLAAWGRQGVCASFLLTLPKHLGEAYEPPTSLVPPQWEESQCAE